QAQVGRGGAGTLAPRAQVAVLLARRRVGPAACRVLVGDGLGVLVPVDDRDAVKRARAAGVDEVLAAGRADVHGVGHVGERDVTHRGADAHVAVPVVPGTEPAGLVVVRVRAMRRDDVV